MNERFTPKQRQAILQRDNYTSQMLHYSEEKGWFKGCAECPLASDERKLNVHHIEPNRIAKDGGNVPENLITVYQCEHTGVRCDGKIVHGEKFVIHPDVAEATEKYRNGDHSAYAEMGHARTKKVENGETYWETDHDAEMRQTAEERTKNAAAHGWKWPERKRRQEKEDAKQLALLREELDTIKKKR